MSMVVRQRWDLQVLLLTKGADSIMLALAAPGQAAQEHIEKDLVGRRSAALRFLGVGAGGDARVLGKGVGLYVYSFPGVWETMRELAS
jgi:hypothetical protein